MLLCHVSRQGVEVCWRTHVAVASAILRALPEVARARRALTEVNQPRVPRRPRTGFVREAGQPHVGAPAVHVLLRSLASRLGGSWLSRTLSLHGNHLLMRRLVTSIMRRRVTSIMRGHILRSGRAHATLEAEALPAVDLLFVFTLQVHVVEACGLAMDLTGVDSLVTSAGAGLGERLRLARGRGRAGRARAVREARVKTPVAPGVLK